ncbi:MAG: division/cell wall cluster transcriptional repressor MraZ [Acidimicrobiia bacterium]
MFNGEYRHSVDEKGRLVLPAKHRAALAPGLVLTKGQDRTLYVFTLDRWTEEVDRVNSLPRSNLKNRNYARSFFGGASDQTLDKQGRLVIPATLREYAGIDREVVVLGVGDRIEVWALDAWNEMAGEADRSFADLEEAFDGEGM